MVSEGRVKICGHDSPMRGSPKTETPWQASDEHRFGMVLEFIKSDDRLWPIVTAGLVLIVYLLTLAPDLTWVNFGGDGAELITASATLGIPHPPGYPVYLVLGKLMSLLPIGSVAYRFNLLSALSVAIATGFVAATTSNLLNANPSNKRTGPLIPVAAGLVFAFIPLVWGQALIAEVYSLNLALLSAVLWMLTQEIAGKKVIAAGVLFGLSLTTHLTSLFFLPLCLYLLSRKQWRRFVLGAVMGLVPLLILPLLAGSSSPVIWGRANTLSGWLWLVSAQIYRPNVMALPPEEWWPRISSWFSIHLWQILLFGLPLIILGLIKARVKDRQMIGALVATAALYAVYAFGYRTIDAIVFVLPGILVFVISLGFWMKKLGNASLLLPVFLLALNFGGQYLGDDLAVRRNADRVMRSVPADAIVITPGDQTATTLLYYQHIEGLRSDLVVVDDTMFQFDWYRERLGMQFPSLTHLENDDVPGFIESNLEYRTICHVGLVAPSKAECKDFANVDLEGDR